MADLDQLETRRLQLEENVAKLRKTLQHWRTWDAEYEGLKEELERGVHVDSEADCTQISNEFAGELVNEKEILDLFGVGKGPVRHPAEVVRLVNRRLDYVQQNVATITKQVDSVESQLSEVLEQIDKENDDPDRAGLPMTEIIEELDEDGNIISSKVTQPESATAQIIDTLRKAGLSDVDSKSKKLDAENESTKDNQSTQSKEAITDGKSSVPGTKSAKEATTNGIANGQSSSDATRKSVKFAENVQEREIPSRAETATTSTSSGVSPSLTQGSFASNQRVIELDDDDEPIGAVIPEDESPEDARLRREMLQYGLNEVGQVVAELDLDENLSDFEDDDFEFEDEYDSELSEEEDEHGRSIRPGITKNYRQQMLELEEKLKSRVIGNLGPSTEGVDPVYDPDELRRLVIRSGEESAGDAIQPAISKGKEPANPDGSGKKGVRFADALDIQQAPKAPEPPAQPKPKATAPIADIVERAPSKQEPTSQTVKAPAKVSRFKQNRHAGPQMSDTNDVENAKPSQSPKEQINGNNEGPILSQTVLERPTSSNARAPEEEDEFDPELQQRQLASEYYRMRNNMIRQQGGFKATEEEKDDPLMEQVDGKVKKVSRFKAARMKF